MQLTFGNMTLELNIFHLSKKHFHPKEEDLDEVCLIDTIVEEQCEQLQLQVELKKELAELPKKLDELSDLCVAFCPWKKKEEILHLLIERDKEKEEPLKLKLKPLPTEFKYAYLEKGDQCLVVISSSLNASQEGKLLGILRKCKQAIGWKISNLKGISPLVCTHHIYMEEEAKLVWQPQRRLNPHMQEVVCTEVLKLL